jgi:uroporphyrinogen-III synthase
LHLRGLVASADGSRIVRGEIVGDAARAEELGAQLAMKLGDSRCLADTGSLSISLDPPVPVSGTGGLAQPLRGRKILITRAREGAQALAERIRALGGEPIEFPTIDFAPLEDFRELDNALARVGQFDWVIFTSANGVRAAAERLEQGSEGAGEQGSRAPQHPCKAALQRAKLAAIGPATARALEELGLNVDFIPTKYLGEQIALELPVESGQRALLLRADIAPDTLARGLTARGVAVTNVAAYRTIMPPARELDLSQVDAVAFTSSSTVRNFVAMSRSSTPGQQPRDALAHIAVFCIGPVTAETARQVGLRVDAVAAEHTMDGLISAIVSHLADS